MPAIRTAVQRQRQVDVSSIFGPISEGQSLLTLRCLPNRSAEKRAIPIQGPKSSLPKSLCVLFLSSILLPPHGFRAQISTEKRKETPPAGELSVRIFYFIDSEGPSKIIYHSRSPSCFLYPSMSNRPRPDSY